MRRDSQTLTSFALFDSLPVNLATSTTAQRAGGARVNADFFPTLQVSPLLGRIVDANDDRPGHEHVAVISHRLWQAAYGGRADVLTQIVNLDGQSYQIVGVMPPGFQYPRWSDLGVGTVETGATDVWVPLALTSEQAAARDVSNHVALARLRPGVTIQQAQAEATALMARLDGLRPPEARGWYAVVASFIESSVGEVRQPLWLLFGSAVLLLMIACSNATHLLLARAADRSQEMHIRAALGAGRGRLLRQMLVESVALALVSGVLGVLVAYGAIALLLRINPGNIPRLEEMSVDARVLMFSLGAAALTGTLCGLVPAHLISRINAGDALRSGVRVIGQGRRLRRFLIVAEVALAVVLLAGGGLLLRSYAKLQHVDRGFTSSTQTMRVSLDGRYGRTVQRRQFFRTVLTSLREASGVQTAGAVDTLPLSHSERMSVFAVEGYPNTPNQLVGAHAATAGYFEAMGTRLVQGRTFTDDDIAGHAPVMIVNETFAKRYFPGESAIGKHVRLVVDSNQPVTWATIVGVVENVRHTNLEDAPSPQVYESFWQSDADRLYLAIRSRLPTPRLITTVRQAVKTIDPLVAVADAHSMQELNEEATARRRFQTLLLTAFSAIALTLAAIGLYGVMSQSVRQRRAEIGVRIALGARPREVLVLILVDGLVLTVSGLIVGIAGALVLTRVLNAMLFDVAPTDVVTFIAVVLWLLTATIVACAAPALRASRVDPLAALKAE